MSLDRKKLEELTILLLGSNQEKPIPSKEHLKVMLFVLEKVIEGNEKLKKLIEKME
jgi:hypothetical protein